MSAQILEFPVTIRIEEFMGEEAVKQQIHQCLGAVIGTFHGQPTTSEMIFAMAKIDEAITLMRSYLALRTLP